MAVSESERVLRELHQVRGQLSGALTMVNRLIGLVTAEMVAASGPASGAAAED